LCTKQQGWALPILGYQQLVLAPSEPCDSSINFVAEQHDTPLVDTSHVHAGLLLMLDTLHPAPAPPPS
jgi:hypothetical protein